MFSALLGDAGQHLHFFQDSDVLNGVAASIAKQYWMLFLFLFKVKSRRWIWEWATVGENEFINTRSNNRKHLNSSWFQCQCSSHHCDSTTWTTICSKPHMNQELKKPCICISKHSNHLKRGVIYSHFGSLYVIHKTLPWTVGATTVRAVVKVNPHVAVSEACTDMHAVVVIPVRHDTSRKTGQTVKYLEWDTNSTS